MKAFLKMVLEHICGAALFDSVYDTISTTLFSSSGTFGWAYSIAYSVYSAIMPVGVMLLFVYFTINLVDKLSSESFTWDQMWRQLALLLAGKYIMENGFQILTLLSNIGMAATDLVANAGTVDGAFTAFADFDALIDNFTSSMNGFIAILAELVMLIILLVPWLLSWIMGLAVQVVCYSRILEIYVRAAFSPVALADIFHSGLNGPGWRFLKNFLATALQGAIILVIAILYSALIQSIGIDTTNFGDILTFVGKYILIYASGVVLIFKSLGLTKEIVGTN